MEKSIDRLYSYLYFKDVKPTIFEKEIGLSNGYLSVQRKRSADMGESILNKIIDNCRDLSPDWLLTGNGEMIKGDTKLILDVEPIIENNPLQLFPQKIPVKIIDRQDIPLYDITAAAGIVQIINGSHAHISQETITIPRAPRCDGAMYVRGDSMYPILKSGDIVMYSEVHNMDIYLVWGEMYIVAFGDEGDDPIIVVKYVKKSSDPNMVTLASQNQNHSEMDIPKSAIKALARVNASIRFQTL